MHWMRARDGLNGMVDVLRSEVSKLPAWMGVVVTSSPDVCDMRMHEHFNHVMIYLESASNLDDIRSYLSYRLSRRRMNECSVLDAVKLLMRKCCGLFCMFDWSWMQLLRKEIAN